MSYETLIKIQRTDGHILIDFKHFEDKLRIFFKNLGKNMPNFGQKWVNFQKNGRCRQVS